MRTVSFGCSLTRGTDLKDIGQQTFDDISPLSASALAWPALVAKALNSEYRSFALGGAGNLCIADRVLHHMPHYADDLLIINWTFIDRFDYSDPQGRHYGNGSLDYLSLTPGSNSEVAQCYYRHLHSEFRDKITGLMYMNTVLDSLLETQQRFIMTCVDPVLFCERWHCPPHVMRLQQKLKPHVLTFEGMNFLEWAKYRGYAISLTGHPLEQAHAAAAELMLPVIQSLV